MNRDPGFSAPLASHRRQVCVDAVERHALVLRAHQDRHPARAADRDPTAPSPSPRRSAGESGPRDSARGGRTAADLRERASRSSACRRRGPGRSGRAARGGPFATPRAPPWRRASCRRRRPADRPRQRRIAAATIARKSSCAKDGWFRSGATTRNSSAGSASRSRAILRPGRGRGEAVEVEDREHLAKILDSDQGQKKKGSTRSFGTARERSLRIVDLTLRALLRKVHTLTICRPTQSGPFACARS